jgi:radical SAM protein with 4Fe4S-binding SPASM domain
VFRLSNLISSVVRKRAPRVLDGSIAIWNFTNRCNLSCHHCYSKADLNSNDKLSTQTILDTLPKLKKSGVKFIIFSGGEPLTRKDIFDIADSCRELGIITYLSTNGLYIGERNAKKIIDSFNYIGISIDGNRERHDYFRGLEGSFDMSLKAVELLNSFESSKVGIRFTITKETIEDLPFIFELAQERNIPKIYISHLVYSGRGLENLEIDIDKDQRREAVGYILDKAFYYYDNDIDIEIVTGNMEMDAILFLEEFGKRYPNLKEDMKKRLQDWGGNSAGRKLLNIDSEGFVKPDPFFPFKIGNIFERDFSEIWEDNSNELLNRLRTHPREISGKCQECKWLEICNGGSRSRAYAISGDLWAEDPSCYLEKGEIC